MPTLQELIQFRINLLLQHGRSRGWYGEYQMHGVTIDVRGRAYAVIFGKTEVEFCWPYLESSIKYPMGYDVTDLQRDFDVLNGCCKELNLI